MLQKIRDNVQGTAAKVIVAIIAIPFAIFGVESLVSSGGDVVVAEVNGDEIHDSELRRAVALQQRQLLAMLGNEADPAMLDESRLRAPALQRLVTQRLLLQGSDELDLGVSEAQVDRQLLGMPQFQQDGSFSQERYLAALRDQGYSPAFFKELVRTDMLVNQLLEGLSESELITEGELARVAAMLQQQRDFGFVRVAAAPLAEQAAPDEAEIEAYYNANGSRFMRPEQVRLAYVELRTEQFIEPVEEAQVRAEYEREVAASPAGTQRHAAHILIEIDGGLSPEQAEAQARELATRARAGEDFAQLAREHSDDFGSRDAGGDLGVSTGDAFPEPFEAALARLAEGEVSEPVRTDAGFHVIKLLDLEEGTPPSFEARRADIEQRLGQSSARPALLQAVEKMRDMAFNAETLEGPARQLSLPVQKSEWLTRDNEHPLFSQSRLMAAAFSDDVLKDGNNSDAIELSPDHFVVLRVAEHRPPAQRSLSEVRPQVVEALRQEQGSEQARQLAEALRQAWQQGGDPAEAAAARGLSYTQVDGASRQGGDTAPELLRLAFEMAPPAEGEASYRIATLDNGDVVALRLQQVIDGKLEAMAPAERQALAAQLRQVGGNASFSGYLAALRADADIEFR
jgi:peptidyl-prolyl cis-trans isomerase D